MVEQRDIKEKAQQLENFRQEALKKSPRWGHHSLFFSELPMLAAQSRSSAQRKEYIPD